MVTRSNIPLIGSDIEKYKMPDVGMVEWERALLAGNGSKDSPIVTEHGQYHPDNLFFEMAGLPCANAAEFLANYNTMSNIIEVAAGMKLRGVNYVEDVVTRTDTPRLHRISRTFGCSPDMRDGEYRRHVPRSVKRRALREAGAHFHFQLRPDIRDTIYFHNEVENGRRIKEWRESGTYVRDMVREISNELALFHQWEHPNEMPWYRVPGTYRLKPYGLEYRSIGAGIIEDTTMFPMLIQRCFSLLHDHWSTVT